MAFAVGEVMEIVGAFLSTLFPLIGPAVVHPPLLLHTCRLFVVAFAGSVPTAVVVVRLKAASAAFASPDSGSLAVHAIVTSPLCQAPSDAPHETSGGVASLRNISAPAKVPLKSSPPLTSTRAS